MSLIYNDAKAAMSAANWAAYDVRAMLVGPSYAPDADHVFVNQVVGELTSGSYARQMISGRYGVVDTTNDLVAYVANNPTWVSLSGGEQVQWLVFYRNVTNDSDSRLLFCLRLSSFATSGDNVTVRFNSGATAGVVFQLKQTPDPLQGPPGPPGVSSTSDELTPIDLNLHELSNQAVFNFMPTALIDVNDDMSVTSLTRFTVLSEGTPQTPVISGGQMTLAHPSSGDKNTGFQEGADIGMCQAAVSINVISRVGSAGNTYENVGVGIAKDSNNFILALWRGVESLASIQVKIGGVSNFRATVSATGWTLPFELGFSLVANSIVFWRRQPGGDWTVVTSYDVTTTIDFKTASNLPGWKGVFWLATQSSQSVTFVFDDFKIGRFGSVGFRDPVVVSNEDGSPRLTGSVVTLTATCTDPTTSAAAYCAVFTLDLVTRVLTQTGVLMISRSSNVQNDNAAHIIAYNDGTFRFFITTWGNTGASNIQILYKNETSLNLLSGARLVSGMTQLSLPLPSGAGAYDPYAIKFGGTWYLAYTVGPSTPLTFYPALVSSPDLAAWTLVGSDSASFPYEGTRIVYLAGQYWLLTASASGTNVYDLTMTYQGKMNSLTVANNYPAHPMLVAYGQYVYHITFDDSLFSALANTNGHFREFRARRYGAHG